MKLSRDRGTLETASPEKTTTPSPLLHHSLKSKLRRAGVSVDLHHRSNRLRHGDLPRRGLLLRCVPDGETTAPTRPAVTAGGSGGVSRPSPPPSGRGRSSRRLFVCGGAVLLRGRCRLCEVGGGSGRLLLLVITVVATSERQRGRRCCVRSGALGVHVTQTFRCNNHEGINKGRSSNS